MEKKTPDFKGVLQTVDRDPKQRKQMGRIALWLNGSENPKAPKYVGAVWTDRGSRFRISLWPRGDEQEPEEEGGEESPSSTQHACSAERSSRTGTW